MILLEQNAPPRKLCLADLALVALAVLVAVGIASPFLAYTVDDSFITFRYGQHLSTGLGPVFNVGERVEGYTSFLWMLLMAASLALRLDPIIVSKVLGVISTLAAGGMLLWSAHAVCHRPRRVGFIALFLLVANAEVAVSSVSGLESTFFMFLITASMTRTLWEEHRGGFPWSSLLFGVAALTRPEGLVLFALHLLFQVLISRQRPVQILVRLGLFILVVLPHWLWRMAYYEQPLPATYYAKLSPVFYRLVVGGLYVLPFLLLFLVMILATLRLRQHTPHYLVWMTLGGIAVAWWEGGDWMIGHRFLLPVVPAWSLLAAVTLSALYDRLSDGVGPGLWTPTRRNVAIALIAGAFLIMNAGQAARFRHYTAVRAKGYDRAHLALANWLDERYNTDTTVALMDVGMIGYYSDLRVVDITGLTDIIIAQSPGTIMDRLNDAAYVLDQEPAAIALVGLDDDQIPDFPIDRRLYDDERFQAAYELHHTLEHYRDAELGTYLLLVFVRRTDFGALSQPWTHSQ